VPGLRAAAARVAAFLGGSGGDWAFVENATAGLNAVISSLAPTLGPGDEVLCLSQVYNAVGNALGYHDARAGACVVTVDVPVPFVDPEPLLSSLSEAIGPRTRLAVFDHITSAGAVLAGTFAVLATLPLTAFAEIGFTVAFGVLLDTLIVRSVLVTALTLDIGNVMWWPSKLARQHTKRTK